MGTLTIRLPDDKHERLRQLARRRHISLNRLLDELTTQALVEEDAYTRFLFRASCGSAEEGLRLLDELDNANNLDNPARWAYDRENPYGI
jgi:predicted transcriptional regulator